MGRAYSMDLHAEGAEIHHQNMSLVSSLGTMAINTIKLWSE